MTDCSMRIAYRSIWDEILAIRLIAFDDIVNGGLYILIPSLYRQLFRRYSDVIPIKPIFPRFFLSLSPFPRDFRDCEHCAHRIKSTCWERGQVIAAYVLHVLRIQAECRCKCIILIVKYRQKWPDFSIFAPQRTFLWKKQDERYRYGT